MRIPGVTTEQLGGNPRQVRSCVKTVRLPKVRDISLWGTLRRRRRVSLQKRGWAYPRPRNRGISHKGYVIRRLLRARCARRSSIA